MIEAVAKLVRPLVRLLDVSSAVLELAIRFFVAPVFFMSGLEKIASWSATLALFEDEHYRVPLLPAELTAYLTTGVELTLPVFLALGLGGRFAAVILFVFNFSAAIPYPGILSGPNDHDLWGWLLAVIIFHGPGKLSWDFLIRRKLFSGARSLDRQELDVPVDNGGSERIHGARQRNLPA